MKHTTLSLLGETIEGKGTNLKKDQFDLYKTVLEALPEGLIVANDQDQPENIRVQKLQEQAGHSIRVSDLAGKVAEYRYGVSPEVKEVQIAGRLHDIGKIGTRERILHKLEKLTEKELDHIKEHPLIAEKILAPFEKLKSVAKVIRHHHERFDGKGYPDGLAGKDIPALSRILAIVDSYDAMTSARPYRAAMSPEDAIREIKKNLGIQFDPEFGKIFIILFVAGIIA